MSVFDFQVSAVLLPLFLVVSCVPKESPMDPREGEEEVFKKREDLTPRAPGVEESNPEDGGPAYTPPALCEDGATLGSAPLLRLKPHHYQIQLRRLFPSVVTDHINPKMGFVHERISVSALETIALQEIAEEVGAAVQADPTLVVQCDAVAQGESECVAQFVSDFAARAFRRPLHPELADDEGAVIAQSEEQWLLNTYEKFRLSEDYATSLSMLVEVILQSSNFIQRVETGEAGSGSEPRQLLPHELAARLSFVFLDEPPSPELLALADAGGLEAPGALRATAEEMLRSDPGLDAAKGLFEELLRTNELAGVLKDEVRFPGFDAALKRDLSTEMSAFIREILSQDGTIQDALLSNRAYLNGRLARYYGVEADHTTGQNSDWEWVDLAPDERAGILTRGLFLAAFAHEKDTSSTLRGHFIRQRFLCEEVGDVPADVNDVPPPAANGTTTRDIAETRLNDAYCGACHRYMDGLGLGFEHYDAIGKWRNEYEEGEPLSAAGSLKSLTPGTKPLEGPFEGAIELSERLAESERVLECMTQNTLEWVLRRQPEDAGDECTEAKMREQLGGDRPSLKALLLSVVDTPQFRNIQGEKR